jgi:hypothetical protein
MSLDINMFENKSVKIKKQLLKKNKIEDVYDKVLK